MSWLVLGITKSCLTCCSLYWAPCLFIQSRCPGTSFLHPNTTVDMRNRMCAITALTQPQRLASCQEGEVDQPRNQVTHHRSNALHLNSSPTLPLPCSPSEGAVSALSPPAEDDTVVRVIFTHSPQPLSLSPHTVSNRNHGHRQRLGEAVLTEVSREPDGD